MKNTILTRLFALTMALCVVISAGAFPAAAENLSSYYSSAEFESQFTYEGNDLGATWSKEATTFRLWAPTATAVAVNLYESGTEGSDDLIESFPMTADVKGTWVATKEGDLNGVYYTYTVTVDGQENEACDPYARTTGVNGKRAMVIDLDSTDPEGWDKDTDPHAGNSIVDAVIYELHVRDLSVDESSGIQNKGKFLGLIETGTKNSQGISTGLDHMVDLGITHLHLLPSYDYGSVDESKQDTPQFNWGYDPVNYNVPEGSYATDPFNGEVRVKEFKQMVKGLHDSGISVVMDVVYNHVYNAEEFCFNKIVPQYFSRTNGEGLYSNGSACGNDTASERSMVQKYIVDSVKYWAEEYHIDGFRFDLAGLIDTDTVNAIVEEVHKTHPNVIFYAEGWTMNTLVTKPDYTMATQKNSTLTPGFAYFSDDLRDTLRGSNSNSSKPGYINGAGGFTGNVKAGFFGAPSWCKSPTQTVNYASCHDGYTLYDRITLATPDASEADRIKMNNLAAAVVMTSQGVPFIHAGEELLRSKPKDDGSGFEHNSYKSSDAVNNLKWDDLSDAAYQSVFEYYKGLIAFRKAHPALRMTDAQLVKDSIKPLGGLEFNVCAYQIQPANGEESEGLVVIFNPRAAETTVELPEGEWTIYVQGDKAGTTALGTASGTVTVDAISTCVLVKEKAAEPETTAPTTAAPTTQPGADTYIPTGIHPGVILCITVGIIAITGAIVRLSKKKK